MKKFKALLIVLSTTSYLISQDSAYLHMVDSLDSIIQVGIEAKAFPGAQILVRHKDSIVLHKSWGHHTYEGVKKVKLDDVYDLASITKVTTGLPILMKWYGMGLIELDSPVSNYMTTFKRSNKKALTLREVLTHQAGLEPYIVFWQRTLKNNGRYKCRTFRHKRSNRYSLRIADSLYLHRRYYKKMRKQIKKSPVRENPKYKYSGLAFLLMPQMIEDISNQSFESYLYRELYKPLDINQMMYNPMSRIPQDNIIPTEYDSIWRKEMVHGTVHDEAAAMLGGVSCNAGLFGNAEDLSKLFQLYLNAGEWKGEQLISPEAVREFTSYQNEDSRRGLGFDKPLREYDEQLTYVAKDASSESYGHSGFTGTMVWADPRHELVYVFLSNRVYPTRTNRNLYKMSLRPKLHQVVYNYILRKDIASKSK